MALCNLGALMVLFGLKCKSVNRAGNDVRVRSAGQVADYQHAQALGRPWVGDCACTPGHGWVGSPAPFRGFPRCPRGGIGRRA